MRGPQRNVDIFLRGLFTEIYWSVDEVILKPSWIVFYSDLFEEVSNKQYYSNMFLP